MTFTFPLRSSYPTQSAYILHAKFYNFYFLCCQNFRSKHNQLYCSCCKQSIHPAAAHHSSNTLSLSAALRRCYRLVNFDISAAFSATLFHACNCSLALCHSLGHNCSAYFIVLTKFEIYCTCAVDIYESLSI